MDNATFTHHELGFQRIVELLAATGLDFGEVRSSSRTVLDTFDGRVHALGLRLQAVQADDALHLEISGPDSAMETEPVDRLPRLAADLPPGPLAKQIGGAVGVRALMPLVTFSDRVSTATETNNEDTPVVHLSVHDSIIVDGDATVPATVDVGGVSGHRKAARRAGKRLERLGFVRLDGDLGDAVLTAAGVSPAGFTSQATVPLDSKMAAAEGFRAVLLNLADTIEANWQGTIDDIDTEFLHDLRVAVRRTRAVINQGRDVLPDEVVATFSDGFTWLAGTTSATRDLDVYTLEWPRYVAGMSPATIKALLTVRRHLDKQHRSARAELVAVLRSKRAGNLMALWRAALGDDGPTRARRATTPLGQVVAKRFRKAHRVVLEHGRRIDDYSPPAHLHDLRKDAKKLRYLIECFASVLPPLERTSFVNQLKALQDNLGEYQDAQVHGAELGVVARELGRQHAATATLIALGRLTERLEQSQRNARTEFATRFAVYDSSQTGKIVSDLLDALGSSSK